MKHVDWIDVLGNNVNAAEIMRRAEDDGMSVEEWVAAEIAELARMNPGEGYDEYNAIDFAAFAIQIEDEDREE